MHGAYDNFKAPEHDAPQTTRTRRPIVLAYAAGLLSAFALRLAYTLAIPDTVAIRHPRPPTVALQSSAAHHYPPPSPTNAFPDLFPSDVGHAGPTPTGAEPAVIATAPSYPFHSGAPHLLAPEALSSSDFDIFTRWGNLSPWFSVPRSAFGLDCGPEPPQQCSLTALHLLHRHGARYPTGQATYGGPANFFARLTHSSHSWKARGQLEFLNHWSYKLGEEILTPFGRQQLYDLGVSMRINYGFLLHNFSQSHTLPVFRTESQDRMLSSALNFALGFFGHPLDGKYQQLITIEDHGFNNTLAPSKTCPNAHDSTKGDRAIPYVRQWAEVYLPDALARLRPQVDGINLSIEDVYTMQQLCAYETVALGYSRFCELFTEKEWEGFDYAVDLYFWYNSAFGSPVARALGIGYVQELVARLTHAFIPSHNSSTNSTLDDNPATFPLDQSLYVDATHEVVVLNVITALNLTNFAVDGPLPTDHIPPNRAFKTSHLAPFATNVQFQLLSCASSPDPQIRIIINDGVVPLTGLLGCPVSPDGTCPLSTFVAALHELIGQTDWAWSCLGDWTVPPGTAWNTTTGDPPPRAL
ncbi:phosphoglycerate mutase-like protein [Trametes gibbosa]|nr:phosphoglycerate mutase-like protein [Trametes gibbosa]